MITYIATETRDSLDVPFTYDHPLYGNAIKEAYNMYTNAGINVTVETSENGLVQTITHTCTDDKAELFTSLHQQLVETIEDLYQNTDPTLPFARSTGVETKQTAAFDADHTALLPIFESHYTLRIPA